MTPPSRLLAVLFLALIAVECLVMASGNAQLRLVAGGLVVVIVAVAWPAARARETYLGVLSLLLLLATLRFADEPAALLARALGQAGFLGAFFLLVGLLREGAIRAPSVQSVGHYLTNQPPGRRFLSVFAGGHYFALLSNLGALSLMTPIIQTGVRANLAPGEPLDEVAQVRERRQLTALMRGFAWILLWAPTAVTQAVLPTLVPGIDHVRLLQWGFTVLAMMTLLAWAEDWLRWRRFSLRRRRMNVPPAPVVKQVPWRGVAVLAVVSGALFGLGLLFILLLGTSIINGVLLAVPPVVVGWLWWQTGNGAALRMRLGEIALVQLPGYVREVLFIAAAGFIGVTAGALLPVNWVAQTLAIDSLPGWLLMAGVSALFWLAANLGLSPITVTVFLGSVLGEFFRQGIGLPTDVTNIAVAIVSGSALATCGAPFSAGSVLLAKATGLPATRLTWHWNGLYVALAYGILVGFYVLIA